LRFVKHIDIDYVRNSEERDHVSAALGNERLQGTQRDRKKLDCKMGEGIWYRQPLGA